MAFVPISGIVPQATENGNQANGMVLKFYEPGTLTPLAVGIDGTGVTQTTEFLLSIEGYTTLSGNEEIPHVDQIYKIILYLNQADADANNTGSAVYSVDNIDVGDFTATAVARFADYNNLALALSATDGEVGDFIITAEYNEGSGIGGGTYEIVSVDPGFNLINPAKTDTSGNFLKLLPRDFLLLSQAGCSFDGVSDFGTNISQAFSYVASTKLILDGQNQTYFTSQTIDCSNSNVQNAKFKGVSTLKCLNISVNNASFFAENVKVSDALRGIASNGESVNLDQIVLLNVSTDNCRTGFSMLSNINYVKVEGGTHTNVGGGDESAETINGMIFGFYGGAEPEEDWELVEYLTITGVTIRDVIYTGASTTIDIHAIICYGWQLLIDDNNVQNVTRINQPPASSGTGCEGIYTKAILSAIVSNNNLTDAGLRDAAITMKGPFLAAYPQVRSKVFGNNINFTLTETRFAGGISMYGQCDCTDNTINGATYYPIVFQEDSDDSVCDNNTITNLRFSFGIRTADGDITFSNNKLIRPIGRAGTDDIVFFQIIPLDTEQTVNILNNVYLVGDQLQASGRPILVDFDYTGGFFQRANVKGNTLLDVQLGTVDNGNLGVRGINATTGIFYIQENTFDCVNNGRKIGGLTEDNMKTDVPVYSAAPTGTTNITWINGDFVKFNAIAPGTNQGWVFRTGIQWLATAALV